MLLKDWLGQVGDSFLDARAPFVSGFQDITWELTPEQIRSLLSLSGFSLVVTSFVPEDLFLFDVTEKLESSALFSELEANMLSASFWREAFSAHGLHLSLDLKAQKIQDRVWRIIDSKPDPITAQSYDEFGKKVAEWMIAGPNELEPIAFTIRLEEDTLKRYKVHLHPDRTFGTGRSALADRHFEELTSVQLGSGRVCGIFLSAKSEGGTPLTEADYSIQVEHLGDRWLDPKNLQPGEKRKSKKLQLREKRTLKEHRGNFISPDDRLDAGALGDKLNKIVEDIEGDPDPFVIQGTPLAGTTVIRLVSSSPTVFKRVKLQVLYKFYS